MCGCTRFAATSVKSFAAGDPMNAPKRIDITPEQLDALLQRVKDNRLEDNDYEIIKAMADTVSYLSQLSDEKASTIKKLLKMLFGDQSEKAPAAGR